MKNCNKKLKIARIVSEKFPVPPVKGGAIQTSVYYSSLLLKDRFDITIFSRPAEAQKKDELKYEPIGYSIIEKFAEKLLQYNFFKKIFVFKFILKAIIIINYVLKCSYRLRRNNYDIILIHNSPSFVPIIRWFNPHKKIILSMHNLHLTHGQYVKVLKWFYKIAVKKSDLIITISKLISDEILKFYVEAEGKTEVVYHGIKIDRFFKRDENTNLETKKRYNLDNDKITIIFAARLVPVKGLHILLDAIKLLKNNELQLVVAGSPQFANKVKLTEYERLIYRKAEKLNNIIFTGYLVQDELALLYSASDIYVLPTIQPFEGCPQSLLEAMASECCVIGDFPELIEDNVNGLLVKCGNSELLAEAIDRAIKDSEKRKILGKNARKTVENYFTIDKYAERLASVLNKI